MKITQDESVFDKNGSNLYLKKNESYISKNILKLFMILFFLIFIVYQTKIINELKNITNTIKENKIGSTNYDLNFKYHLYEREMITEKMKQFADWQLLNNEPYFINGIIRKFNPKKCLEIGVAKGGSSIIILNALKDVSDSFLVSLDLFSYNERYKYHVGENVKKYFPELAQNNKWQLYTGEQPHKFLEKLNLKFDFLYLDTMHITPGELINIFGFSLFSSF